MGSAAFAAAAGFAPAQSAETVLYGFKCSNDTAGPAGSLISDGSGALYGTTIGGNASAFGLWHGVQADAAGLWADAMDRDRAVSL